MTTRGRLYDAEKKFKEKQRAWALAIEQMADVQRSLRAENRNLRRALRRMTVALNAQEVES